MKSKSAPQIYQFKVSLRGIRPPIWRRIQVPSNASLYALHTVLQIAMGWGDEHLHAFSIGGKSYGDPQDDELGDLGRKNEKRYRLEQLGLAPGEKLLYEYDFGDSWEHILELEEIFAPAEGTEYPRCIKGKRACPPEDCGGIWGYQNMLEVVADPTHPDHQEMMQWLPDDFDPEAFDLEGINQTLRAVHGRSGRKTPAEELETEDNAKTIASLSDPKRWEHLMIRENEAIAQDLALRRDVVMMLEYLRDNKVTGTPSTGNFPVKAVKEIAARMALPPELEPTAGDQVRRLRSEAEAWPVFFRHLIASAAGLIDGGAGRRWRLTSNGKDFLGAPILVQVWVLFSAWWQEVDWVFAFPFSGLANGLPEGFEDAARNELLAIPTPAPVAFAAFADRLAAASDYAWPAPDAETAREFMHRSIESMVIEPLAEFEAVATVYEPSPELPDAKTLTAFRLTALGKGLLLSIAVD